MTLRRIVFLFLISLALVATTGCGSKQKKMDDAEAGAEAAAEMTDKATEMGAEAMEGLEGLELNADSDSGKTGPVGTVYFDFDSSQLRSDTQDTLNINAEFLTRFTSVEIQIEGHCDERGGVQYNLALGERRAKAIKDYLVSMGVESHRVTTISFGKERPVAFGHNEAAWSKNRRGNFVITQK